MGLIVDDHDKGVHGELRRESFVIFSDFGKEWSLELDLGKLDELLFVLQEIKKASDRSAGRAADTAADTTATKCPLCGKEYTGNRPCHQMPTSWKP